MITTTGSISQDALLEGYQVTCHEGVSKLLKIEDLTVEGCKDFIPVAIKTANGKLEEYRKALIEINIFMEDSTTIEKDAKINTFNNLRSFLFSSFAEKHYRAVGLLKTYKYYNFLKDIEDIRTSEPIIDFINGVVNIDIVGRIKHSVIETVLYKVQKNAKSARVNYVDYDMFTDYLIPEHIVDEIKKAKYIGLTNIEIAYPVLEDTKPKDPLVIGYVKVMNDTKMFLITRFGVSEAEDKQLKECYLEGCKS